MLGVVNARFAMLTAARSVQVQMVECKPTLQHHARPGFSIPTVSCPFLFSGNCFRRINMVRRRRSCYKRCIMLNFGKAEISRRSISWPALLPMFVVAQVACDPSMRVADPTKYMLRIFIFHIRGIQDSV